MDAVHFTGVEDDDHVQRGGRDALIRSRYGWVSLSREAGKRCNWRDVSLQFARLTQR